MKGVPATEDEIVPYIRRLFYDFSEDGCLASDSMGFFPLSREGAQKEHAESERRLDEVEPLMPILTCMGRWLAQLVAKDEDDFDYSVKAMSCLLTSALVGSISVLVDAGTLEVNKR